MERLIIQVRRYPYVAGSKSLSVVVDDLSLEAAESRIDLLYRELDKNGQAKIIFKR